VPASPLAQPLSLDGRTIGNRFAILPMEGWDAERDGRPGPLTIRRWRHFGASGAKLIWGGEAVAVRHDGRANPNQLLINEQTLPHLAALRETLVTEHRQQFARTDDLLVGLQLTHSGRFSRPNDKQRAEPLIVYHHPLLDSRHNLPPDYPVLGDEQLDRLCDEFVRAARLAQRAGFEFVDIKHCHGYLGHELLSAFERPGRYGGSFENRTRLLRQIVAGVRAEASGLGVAVRFSAADMLPFHSGPDGLGEPEPFGEIRHSSFDIRHSAAYPYAFGGDGTGLGFDLTEPRALLDLFRELRIRLVCVTLGTPYYNPHILRPALFPPSDGYLPPEDPLIGVARHVHVTAELKRHAPDLVLVGSGYTYLQEWLPPVAQAVLRRGWTDFIGLGRMVLSYPELPADVLSGRPLRRKQFCRTFSECTTAPRNGLVSGCYPLDPHYKELPEAQVVAEIKHRQPHG